jgi:methyl-accepting chemotaxis protein
MRLTIKAKITGAFALTLSILAILGGFSIYELSEVNATSTDMAVNWMPSIRLLGAVNAATGDFRAAEELHVLQTDDAGMTAAEASMKAASDSLAKSRAQYEPLISSDDERQTYKDFSSLWDQYMEVHKTVQELSRANKNTDATALINGKSSELYSAASAKVDHLVEINNQGGMDASAHGDALYAFSRNTIIGVIVISFIAVAVLAFMIVRNVSVPITRMTAAMAKLGAGDKTIMVEGLDRSDEIGGMAQALQVFKDTAIEAERMAAEQAAAQQARAKRAQVIEELTTNFDREATAIVKTVSAAATEMQATATSMTGTAEETARQANAVGAGSEQTSANVQTVASATEELASSVAEITRQMAESTKIASDAVQQANKSGLLVKALSDAAQKIGAVVNLINEIASQTNLLALNATIEAARAGDAGKGFAVVASEVKSLANQTARATEEIGTQISAIQQATSETVQAIDDISTVIKRISEITTTVAAAVEEQGAATQEIARSVQQAAQGTQEVSSNIISVTEAAQGTGVAANELLSASADLAKQSEMMRGQVETFIARIKAA